MNFYLDSIEKINSQGLKMIQLLHNFYLLVVLDEERIINIKSG